MNKYFKFIGYLLLVAFLVLAIVKVIDFVAIVSSKTSALVIIEALLTIVVYLFVGPSLAILFISYANHVEKYHPDFEHFAESEEAGVSFESINDSDMEIYNTIKNEKHYRLSDVSYKRATFKIDGKEFGKDKVEQLKMDEGKNIISFYVDKINYIIHYQQFFILEARSLYNYLSK